MKTSIRSLSIITPVIIGLALLPDAHAVVPPPDGGYPGGNTAEGTSALATLTTGVQNTALGHQALWRLSTSNQNTATGFQALMNTTTGNMNVANGAQALFYNTTGSFETATGFRALYSNTTGTNNTANGFGALNANTIGFENTATGYRALYQNTNGGSNTANGVQALFSNTTGDANTADGWHALSGNTTGMGNTAIGVNALVTNTTGGSNTAIGEAALFHNFTGMSNTAIGVNALSDTNGNNNVALGFDAGSSLSGGSNNIDIGAVGISGESNTIRLGRFGTHTRTFIVGISGSTVPGGVPVIIDNLGHLGTINSSARYKEAIRPMDKASEAILALQPVTFRYKHELDPDGIPQFGLIAEEVEKVDPRLVARDDQDKPYTVRYEAVNAMLLNEFLKEHRKVEEQQATITQLRKELQANAARQQEQIEALTLGLQKVSAQVEMAKPVGKVAKNDL